MGWISLRWSAFIEWVGWIALAGFYKRLASVDCTTWIQLGSIGWLGCITGIGFILDRSGLVRLGGIRLFVLCRFVNVALLYLIAL